MKLPQSIVFLRGLKRLNQQVAYDENQSPIGKYYKVAQVNGRVFVEPVKVPSHVLKAREKQKRLKEEAAAVQSNRERNAALSPRFIAFLTVAMIALILVCAFYLTLQSQLTERMKTVSSMQTQLEQMISDNDSLESRLATSGDLNAVKEEAGDLGMSTPSKEQIVTYSLENPEYVVQYENVNE